jgi:hypothetical protein
MKVSRRAMVGVIAATALIAPLALATSAQAAPKGGKQESRSSARTEASREAKPAEARRESPKPSCSGGAHHDDDAAPVVQLPA